MLGQDKWPTTLTGAYNMLVDFRGISGTSHNSQSGGKHLAFIGHGDENNQD